MKTALFAAHKRLGAKISNYCGWMMPIEYKSGSIKEHMNVRQNVGLFDVSHMGFLSMKGPDLFPFLGRHCANNISKKPFRATYTVLPNENGGCVDDTLVYNLEDDEAFIVPNCVNSRKVEEHLRKYGQNYNLEIESRSKSILALQGGKSKELLAEIVDLSEGSDLNVKNGICQANFWGKDMVISNTGYTGEKGYEIFIDSEIAEEVWELLLEKGDKYGIMPIGLSARDSLRLEMGFPLYGHELGEKKSLLGSRSGWSLKNKECIGFDKLRDDKKQVGLVVVDKGMLKDGYEIVDPHQESEHELSGNVPLGMVTSGGYSPTLKKSIGIGELPVSYDKKTVGVKVRGSVVECKIEKFPLYKSIK